MVREQGTIGSPAAVSSHAVDCEPEHDNMSLNISGSSDPMCRATLSVDASASTASTCAPPIGFGVLPRGGAASPPIFFGGGLPRRREHSADSLYARASRLRGVNPPGASHKGLRITSGTPWCLSLFKKLKHMHRGELGKKG